MCLYRRSCLTGWCCSLIHSRAVLLLSGSGRTDTHKRLKHEIQQPSSTLILEAADRPMEIHSHGLQFSLKLSHLWPSGCYAWCFRELFWYFVVEKDNRTNDPVFLYTKRKRTYVVYEHVHTHCVWPVKHRWGKYIIKVG